MHSRFMRIAAIAAAIAAASGVPLAAEPLKAPVPQASQPIDRPVDRPAQVLLASSEIRAAGQASDGQAVAPAKRPRAARVTSCRCAGQTPPQP